MKKSFHTFSERARSYVTRHGAKVPPGQKQEQAGTPHLAKARTWILEGLLAAAFGGAIYFLS